MPHGIFGWELPPGVSVNDIPGNRPEDAEWEQLLDNLWDKKKNPAKFTIEEWASSAKLYENNGETHIDSIIAKILQYGIEHGIAEAADIQAENRHYELREIERVIAHAKTPQEALDRVKAVLGIDKPQKKPVNKRNKNGKR